MAKKKLLNEAQVRRFMGLAGLNALKEGIYEEEPAADEEAPVEEPVEGGEEMEVGAEEPVEEPPVEEPALDAEEPAPEEEEQEVMEALSGINLELNEDELVQEVAKRVAQRLLKAKKAHAQLDAALGRKKK